MVETEREIGAILEGIENLKSRYNTQEGRLINVESNISHLANAFTAQPAKCLHVLEEKFVTKDKFEPVSDTNKIIKKASIFLFCTLVSCLAILLIYIRGG